MLALSCMSLHKNTKTIRFVIESTTTTTKAHNWKLVKIWSKSSRVISKIASLMRTSASLPLKALVEPSNATSIESDRIRGFFACLIWNSCTHSHIGSEQATISFARRARCKFKVLISMLRVRLGSVAKWLFVFFGDGAKAEGDKASLRVSSNATYSDRCLPGGFVDRLDPLSGWLLASEAFSNDAFVLGGLGCWELVTLLFSGREEVVSFASVVAGLIGRGGYEYSNGGWVRTSEIYFKKWEASNTFIPTLKMIFEISRQ